MIGALTGPAIRALVLCAFVATAHADDDAKNVVDDALVRVREHFAKGELAAAKQLLVATYARTPRADLLFALGQVEFNLGHFKEAIDYYERFLATNPGADEAALAHQAIGTARARVDQAPRVEQPPQPPRRIREWDVIDTALLAGGALAIATGTGVFVVGYRGNAPSGSTLSDHDRLLDRSLRLQRTGVAVAAGGTILVGLALVRWRVRRVEVAPIATARTAGLAVGGAW